MFIKVKSINNVSNVFNLIEQIKIIQMLQIQKKSINQADINIEQTKQRIESTK